MIETIEKWITEIKDEKVKEKFIVKYLRNKEERDLDTIEELKLVLERYIHIQNSLITQYERHSRNQCLVQLEKRIKETDDIAFKKMFDDYLQKNPDIIYDNYEYLDMLDWLDDYLVIMDLYKPLEKLLG
jgi:GrpB-like predicted nucleotidyltransferase (UPF0157 family)